MEMSICSIDFNAKGTRIATSGYGTVNCVRWSRGDGEFLASGSDDKLVLIWELDTASEAAVGFGQEPEISKCGELEDLQAACRPHPRYSGYMLVLR
ncbi:HIR complex subunit [Entomophthora muscae]|uniref:HIR complex subunit n=1 Tax=Entomophthora muscae TaxID=34485 RepID=A0ACC2TNU6_9FUNG|nr:HIR complex subunit [Entomophthora muscae]